MEAAFLCIESQTGSIKALVGGKIIARRNLIGRFKPDVSRVPLLSLLFMPPPLKKDLPRPLYLMDSPISYRGSPAWVPQNFDHKFLGPTTLRTGLIQSRNIVSIKILQRIGIPYAIQFARQLGISSPLYPNLSLALGSSGVSLWEMVTAYNCFPNLGQRVPPYFIQQIFDRNKQTVYTYRPKAEQVMEP